MAIGDPRQGRRVGRRFGGLCLLGSLALAGLAGLAAGRPGALGSAYAAVSVGLEERFHTRVPAGDLRLALGPRGRDVRVAGEIGEGAAQRLKVLLDANPHVARIHLTSDGGLVDEAVGIGALIADRGLSTYVPDYCVSACTLAFARGRERFLVTGGRLGFHAPYDPGLFGQVFQADATAERAAYLAAGIEPGFVGQALAVASADLWIPDAARLLQANVVTQVVDTDRFPDSTLDDDPSPEGARAAVLRALPLLEGFATRPNVLARLAGRYRDGYFAGRSEGEALDRLRRDAAREIGRAVAGADDATILALGRYLHRAMRAGDTSACLGIGTAGNLLLAQETLNEADEGPALLARAAGQGAPVESGPVRAEIQRSDFARDCPGLTEAYAHALSRPDPAPALRALMLRKVRPADEAFARP
ncbi:hypothetical protein G3T14_04265 [Methylobacterium sp. BTF04]|uniref:COG3904 family protein n=1 Tax=Methylobacterium sp. BTF04 TaxID=2708300 RepID=UPI0013D230BB|nr:hypothetical protein [Methylobacterium sp. BTF04]NEU11340.1 hypothetical protein [Methylobacterium sp. BTF04]